METVNKAANETASKPVKKRRGRRRWLVGGLVVVALAAAAFFVLNRKVAPAPKRTLAEAVAAGQFTREVSGTGVVKASQERDLTFGTAGTVAGILVSEGDAVTAGEVLATLDTASAERDLASSRASLQSSQADLERLNAQQQVDRIDTQTSVASGQDTLASAQETLADAQNALTTTQQLFDAGAASQNDLTSSQAAVDGAQRRVESATLTLQSAQMRQGSFDQLASSQRSSAAAQVAGLETTVANLEQTLQQSRLVAPFAGTVATLGFETGDAVGGASAGASLRLVDTSSLYISAEFDENRAGELAAGQKATVTPDANAETHLSATVRRVGVVATRTNNAAQLSVDLDFDTLDLSDSEPAVRPGYTVTARVTVNALENVLLIPLEAITQEAGDGGESSSFVYKVTESEPGRGTLTRATVNILDRNATVAAAESDALKAGDLIAVISLDALAAGDPVSYDPVSYDALNNEPVEKNP